jgi:hypothetical protein
MAGGYALEPSPACRRREVPRTRLLGCVPPGYSVVASTQRVGRATSLSDRRLGECGAQFLGHGPVSATTTATATATTATTATTAAATAAATAAT